MRATPFAIPLMLVAFHATAAGAVDAWDTAPPGAVAGQPSPPQNAAVSRTAGLRPVEPVPGSVGVKTIQVAVPERGTEMPVTLWYPTAGPGRSMVVGDGGPLFQGTAAMAEAPAAQGRRPLIVLSQGGLRSGPNIGAWMASRLADSWSRCCVNLIRSA